MSEQPKFEVGQHVLIDHSQYGRTRVSRGVVTKITPTGRINVDVNGCNYQFKDMWLIGGGKWSQTCLVNPSREAELLAKEAEQIARDDLQAIINKLSAKCYKAKLIADLEAALKIARGLP